MTCTIFPGFYCYLYENFLVLVASQSHYIRLWSIKTFNGKSLENTRCQRIMYCSILASKIQKGVNPIMPTCFQSQLSNSFSSGSLTLTVNSFLPKPKKNYIKNKNQTALILYRFFFPLLYFSVLVLQCDIYTQMPTTIGSLR